MKNLFSHKGAISGSEFFFGQLILSVVTVILTFPIYPYDPIVFDAPAGIYKSFIMILFLAVTFSFWVKRLKGFITNRVLVYTISIPYILSKFFVIFIYNNKFSRALLNLSSFEDLLSLWKEMIAYLNEEYYMIFIGVIISIYSLLYLYLTFANSKITKKNNKSSEWWNNTADIILNNRILIILFLLSLTSFFVINWNLKFTYTEANLLPENHPENIKYRKFQEKFGEEGNLIVISVKDSTLFTIEKLNAWNNLSNSFKDKDEYVSTVIALGDLQKLNKDKEFRRFKVEPFITDSIKNKSELELLKNEIFNKSPFYDKFLLNSESEAIRTAINLKSEIVNTQKREKFITDILEPEIDEFEKRYNLDVRISGMPYVRTKYSQTIKSELGKFLALALIVTSLIFFLFFKKSYIFQ